MHKLARFLSGATLAAGSFCGHAHAQDPSSITVGDGTVISIGGGAQFLKLPDIDFTFLVNNAGTAVRHTTNDSFDEYGGVVIGSVETPLGYWGSTPVTAVFSGSFVNVDNSDHRNCTSTARLACFTEDIIDHPNTSDSFGFGSFISTTHRDVDFWGASTEARFGRRPAPLPDSGGYLFRFGYVGVGADVRGIYQDNAVKVGSSAARSPKINYTESLDTTYWGSYLAVGGEYNVLGYLGIGKTWGLRSFVTLRAGVYDASTNYGGHFRASGPFPNVSTRLSLSDDKAAFIGGGSFETRKQFGPRTSLSLLTDYEWFSYAPQMKYVDADVPFAGDVNRTHIAGDDAFAVRTQLRFNIGLGPKALYAAPQAPLK